MKVGNKTGFWENIYILAHLHKEFSGFTFVAPQIFMAAVDND
jgi:hypothetical protein